MTDTEPTTLLEFGDDAGENTDEDGVTPEQNAEDIEHLLNCVERLTDHVGAISDDVGREAVEGPDGTDPETDTNTESTATERMFQ